MCNVLLKTDPNIIITVLGPANIAAVLFHRYKNDPEILAMTNLVAAYQRNDILEFEKIIKVGFADLQRNTLKSFYGSGSAFWLKTKQPIGGWTTGMHILGRK